ncbi:TIR domain-containing protein [Streptomyces sp. NPDC057555]|uniref:TIR domain-containing protein n=1 Tax=Streptomyces sp. NPDC057555 TaxID=3346166 RepID=UPI0036B5D982
MPDIFVNYRTGDEEATATLIERELSRRFGSERVFRASKSIGLGRSFPRELIIAVRRSSVMLVVIGGRWADAQGPDGGRALDNPEDWTRREILEAFESGLLVVPVLVGRATRLDRAALPPALSELADQQYRRLDHRNAEADLAGLGDELADLVPQLAVVDADRLPTEDRTADDGAAPARGNRTQARDIRQRAGIGTLNGDLSGTFVNEPQAPVHAGQGDQYNGNRYGAPQFSGDNRGVNYVAGNNTGGNHSSADNSGTVQQRFGGTRPCADED